MEDAPRPQRAGWVLPAMAIGAAVVAVLAVIGVVALVGDDDEAEAPDAAAELEGSTWTLVTGDGPAVSTRDQVP